MNIEEERELKKKYQYEKQRIFHDNSIIANAVFNLNTNETLEIVRSDKLAKIAPDTSMEDFCSEISSCIVEDDSRNEYCEIFNRDNLVLKYKKGIQEQGIEFQRRLPGNKVIWVKARFYVMNDPDGEDILLFYSCSDINIRKSLEIMTSAIVAEDYDILGYVDFVDDSSLMWYGSNSSRQIGTDNTTLIEENYSKSLEWFVNNAVVPEEREELSTKIFIQRIKRELSKNEKFVLQVHIRNDKGEIRTKEIKYTQYNQKTNICMFTQTDITELLEKKEKEKLALKNALDSMQQANAAQSEFLAKMSHELRTPLNVIIGSAALAMDISNADDEMKEYVRQINYSGQYLLSMINDILDSRKMQNGEFSLQNEWIKPENVLAPAIKMMASEFYNHGINFVYDEDCTLEEDLEYWLDVTRCRQIVTNLLNNALKFTPAKGTVAFHDEHLSRNENTAYEKFIISDTGCGMSEEFQRKMFEPFSQERNETTASIQGTGLGLTVVKQLVDGMNGTITVESELNKGTVFTIVIPFPWRKKEKSSETVKADSKDYKLDGLHILVVEDHAMNAMIARKLLEKKNMIVDVASNGKIAVEAFMNPQKHYDLILMDIRMPIMDGLTAASIIRETPKTDAKHIPIIAMTANAYEEDIKAAHEAGMDDHLSKPVDPDKLYRTISHFTVEKNTQQ